MNFQEIPKEKTKVHNPNWTIIPDQSNRLLINGESGSEKINSCIKFSYMPKLSMNQTIDY